MKLGVAVGFVVAGFLSWYFPTFNGVGFAPSTVTDGEGRIVAAVLFVGAAIVWFMPSKDPSE